MRSRIALCILHFTAADCEIRRSEAQKQKEERKGVKCKVVSVMTVICKL